MKYNAIPVLLLSSLIVACSSAPFSNETTARSLGKGNWSSQFGATAAFEGFGGVYLRQGYGVFDAWDLGINAETTSAQMGLWTRYSFINPLDQGVALALIGGAGAGKNTKIFENQDSSVYNIYAGPILSYKAQWFEAYTLLRANYVYGVERTDDQDEFEEEYIYDTFYGSYALGANFWFNHFIAFTADANILFKADSEDSVSDPYFNVGLLFRY